MKDAVFAFIDAAEAIARELETALTALPAISPDSEGEGELDKCIFLEDWLRAQGITQLERYDAPDARAKGEVRPNLVATIPGKRDGPEESRLWVMSHLDVVPPGDMSLWESDPFALVYLDDAPLGARLIGRGVEDNQQGLTSAVIAALALLRAGVTPERTVKLLFVADEENGSDYGVDWLIKNVPALFREQDMALIPDGGDPQGDTIEIAEKNLLWVRFAVLGVQGHGSRPDQAINAHLAGADLALRLHAGLSQKFSLQDPLFEPDYSTFQPTKREANVPNINTIPAEDIFYMDMRILPQYTINEVLVEIEHILEGVEEDHRVSIAITTVQRVESQQTPQDSPLVGMLSAAIQEVYGVKARTIGIGGGTVGAFLRNRGIHSAVWSRIEGTAHQPNEYALIKNILGDAKVLALLMMGQ